MTALHPPTPLNMTEKNYFRSLSGALRSRSSYEIASLLCPPVPSTVPPRSDGGTRPDIEPSRKNHPGLSSVSTILDGSETSDWQPASSQGYVVHTYCSSPSSYAVPFASQSGLHSSLNRHLGQSAGNWLIPCIVSCCRNTFHLALAADQDNVDNKKENLERAVTLIQESFSRALNDRKEFKADTTHLDEESSKKIGVLPIVNILFSIYFRLNNLRLCKNLLRPVESQGLHERPVPAAVVDVSRLKRGRRGAADDSVIKSGMSATYRYYVGRLNMFEDQYDAAEGHLGSAWKYCGTEAASGGAMRRNRRRILNYLLPVKMLRGRLPTKEFLTKYGLLEFLPLVESIRKGDLKTFNDSLNIYQEVFIRRGTFLLLEKCKTVCYRNLFKRIYLITGLTQIPLENILSAFKCLEVPVDLDEVECILANLIYRGFVKGYISHSKRILVLSKKDPFPVSAVIK
eukprot:CAMPEP_0194271132 /NCGR_PEP_ID=MMETSP0169-20130528/4999_1 /TAXON_ID=218684 /ORGANISM="Corethron pennatum, Strain L29A3" /LENGTH=456 /DNA_ID=CAMNT_0039013417 /DNA_START=101 /DNA_END=1471 /DNA_ORIENTATION=+